MTSSNAITPLLALETSGTTGGAALLGEHHLLGSVAFTSRTLYSQRLLPSIEWLLNRCDIRMTEIRAVAVSSGPGSFTGLRIGMSAAKAIAYANKVPIAGVSTLEALALRAATPGNDLSICPILDARQGEVYAGLYKLSPNASSDSAHELSMPQLERQGNEFAGTLEDFLSRVNGPTLFTGEGLTKYGSTLRERLGDWFLQAPSIRNLPSAEEIAWLGVSRIREGHSDDLVLLEPSYLRHSYAEKQKGR